MVEGNIPKKHTYTVYQRNQTVATSSIEIQGSLNSISFFIETAEFTRYMKNNL